MRALPGCFEGPMAFGNITMANETIVGSTLKLHNRGPPDPYIASAPHYFDIQVQPPLANTTVVNISYVNSPPTP